MDYMRKLFEKVRSLKNLCKFKIWAILLLDDGASYDIFGYVFSPLLCI